MFGGTRSARIRQRLPSPQAASKKHSVPGVLVQCPGANPARPRRSMLFRSDDPSCEKSQVRPSWPPKSAWQVEQVTYDASRDVLTTLPGTRPVRRASSKSGAACPRPIPFGTLESRAAVLKSVFPSRMAGKIGSQTATAVPPKSIVSLATQLGSSAWRLTLSTGSASSSGTQSEPGAQSLLVAQGRAASALHRRLAGVPEVGSARPVRRRLAEERRDVPALPLPRVEDVEAVGHPVDDEGNRPVGGELDVGRVVRPVDVELADDVTVAAVELVDAEARDVVQGRLVDVAHGGGVREGQGLGVLPSPGRCGLGERAVGEAREELGARLPLEAREPLEET